jgi:hypothetical protein
MGAPSVKMDVVFIFFCFRESKNYRKISKKDINVYSILILKLMFQKRVIHLG